MPQAQESFSQMVRRIPAPDYLALRRAFVRDVIADRLAFYSPDHENARRATALAARQERRAWRRVRAGLPAVPSILAKREGRPTEMPPAPPRCPKCNGTALRTDSRSRACDCDAPGLACPMCEGSGYIEDGAREDSTCAGCDGSGLGLRCACGAEIVPGASRVTHDCSPDDSEEEVHTPERCARHTPRDGWEVFASPAAECWTSTEDGMPEWCEPFAN